MIVAAAVLWAAAVIDAPAVAASDAARKPAKRQARVVVKPQANPGDEPTARAKRRPAARQAPAAAAPAQRPPRAAVRAGDPGRASIGQAIGLRLVDDPLDLRSSVALVVDQHSGEALFQKNPAARLPIASITKVMTAMVVLDAQQSPSELVEITTEDIDTERFSRSRLKPGTRLARAELLQLALMASENRAANALGRNYPGGMTAWVAAANAKARELGMDDSAFVEPTGLSSRNVSTARDLARMVRAAAEYPEIRQYSTATELSVEAGPRARGLTYHNTNRLIDSPSWDIGLSKTGYIIEAGSCLVMQARVEGRALIMVLLDADARHARFADAVRIKQWLERGAPEKLEMRGRGGVRPSAQARS